MRTDLLSSCLNKGDQKLICLGFLDLELNLQLFLAKVYAQLNADLLKSESVRDYTSVLENPDLDAVIICSETNLHEEIIMKVAEAKKHCFVEKPLGMGQQDSERMMTALENSGVMFQT